jgi:hypothetical protein
VIYSVLLTIALGIAAVQGPPQTPPRDAPSPAQPGTATLRGRVLAGDTGAPVVWAVVWLHSVDGKNADTNASTDERGRFEFARVRAGSFRLMARPPEGRARLLTAWYGAAWPDGIGRLIDVSDGEARERLDITLAPSAAIEGRVVDDAGEPLANITVQLTRVRPGRTEPFGYRRAETDDLGRFRIFGVSEGDYLVSARSENFGAWPPVPLPKLVPTFYPSAVNEAEAQRLHVKPGQQIDGVDVQMVRTKTYRMSGVIVDSQARAVSNARPSLTGYSGSYSGSNSLSADAAGHFVVAGVVPGEYEVSIGVFDPPNAGTEFGRVSVFVADADVDDVVLATRPAADVTGRIVFDPPAGTKLPPVTVLARAMFHGNPGHGDVRVPVQPDRTFLLKRVTTPTLVRLDAPAGWWLKSVLLNGEDVTDTPVEFGARDSGKLDVVVTSRASVVDGRVADDRGEPVRDGVVLLFPADPAAWVAESSRLRSTELKGTPDFHLTGLRPGRYLIVAASYDRMRGWPRRDALEMLARDATEVVVGEDERRVVDLKLKPGTREIQ